MACRRLTIPLFAVVFVLAAAAPAHALEGHTGGTSGDVDQVEPAPAPSSSTGTITFSGAGGVSADDARGAVDSGAVVYGEPAPRRPVARLFAVSPGRVREGDALGLRLRIDESGVKAVSARVVVLGADGRVGARFSLGRVRANRLVTRTWPARAKLAPGSWLVRLHVKDPDGATLARAASTSGKANLVVVERPKPAPQPQPQPQPAPQPADPQPVAPSAGAFPVAGPHSFGGEGSRFGAGRPGHRHEGQDVAAAEGVPVVSPVPGTVSSVAFQKDGAGHYVVITGDDGRGYFFAHLKTGSITVKAGQRVGAATTIGAVGSTGSSSGPHLHFEIWEGGWRTGKGRPVDPLPQLRAWDR